MDYYDGFSELKKHEREGMDYRIEMRKGSSPIAIMAPHGGYIEPGTADIADAIAGNQHAFWVFKGLKNSGNGILHITSSHFDEPGGIRIARGAQTVITIHGCHGKKSMVYVGGRHEELKNRICRALCRAGFKAEISTTPGLRGEAPANLCNRSTTGKGVQLEITEALRKRMFTPWDDRGIRKRTEAFFRLITALNTALSSDLT